MGILVFIVTFLFLVVTDLKKSKKPFDTEGKEFDVKKDWFSSRWDDALSWLVGGGLGALLSSEIAIPIINKYLDWPELAEGAIDMTSIMLCTLIGAKILEKILGSIM